MDCKLGRILHNLNDEYLMVNMHRVDTGLAALDLRVLNFLRLLLQTGSVTRAGEILGISQPAASRILARIRDLVGDPMLVRTQTGYQLTDHARSLQGPVLEAIAAMEAVFRKSIFEPAEAAVTFRIACTDYAVACVLGPVMQKLADIAPTIRMDVSPLIPDSFAMIDDGEIDFALYASVGVKGDFVARKLFDDSYALVMRDGHPLLELAAERGALEPKDLAGFRQVEFAYPTREYLQTDPVLRVRDDVAASAFTVPFFTAMPFMIAQSDAVAPVPARFAALLSGFSGITAVPYRPDQGFPYYLIWHERARHNPAVRWFVAQVAETMKSH